MQIRPIEQLASYLSGLTCHEITISNNVIKAKSLIRSKSFPSFQIRYLKDGSVSVKPSKGKTIRYYKEEDLFSIGALGSMAALYVIDIE